MKIDDKTDLIPQNLKIKSNDEFTWKTSAEVDIFYAGKNIENLKGINIIIDANLEVIRTVLKYQIFDNGEIIYSTKKLIGLPDVSLYLTDFKLESKGEDFLQVETKDGTIINEINRVELSLGDVSEYVSCTLKVY